MSSIPTVRTIADLRGRIRAWRAEGVRIALVPTMGALHAGHLSLIGLARQKATRVVASLFVNPTQFAPTEDFHSYPRDEQRDAALLRAAGCDLLYAPDPDEMYPDGFATTVTVAAETTSLEGAVRPDHFAGVATVVAKLLIQVAPDVAVFGEKDYQQLHVIRRLTADLDLAVEIIGAPIVRDGDGLALSSRNAYLSARERVIAPSLHRALEAAAAALRAGTAVARVEAEAIGSVLGAGFEAVDYIEVRSADRLARLGPGPLDGTARLLAAARILGAARLGRTRLLDNIEV